jgi:Rrf2 family protein
MVHLAIHYRGLPVPLREIAEREDMPEKYLEAIFSTLRRGRLVESAKGKHGGYRLSQSPEKLTLLDVVRVFEPGLLTADIHPDDADRAAWDDVEAGFVEKLQTMTLAYLVDSFRRQRDMPHYTI